MTLTCTVELSPAVNVPVTVNTVWTGPDGFSTNNTAQPVMESTLTYVSTTVIISFTRNQSGNYSCMVTITSNNSFLLTSDSFSSTIRVGKTKLIMEYCTQFKIKSKFILLQVCMFVHQC